MKVLCAWCNCVIGGRGAALSHGICRRCFHDLFQPQFDFMSSLPTLASIGQRARRPGLPRPDRSQAALQPALF